MCNFFNRPVFSNHFIQQIKVKNMNDPEMCGAKRSAAGRTVAKTIGAVVLLMVAFASASLDVMAADPITIMFKRTTPSEAPKKISGTTVSSFVMEGVLGADYVRSITRQSGTFTQYRYGLMMGEKDKSAEFTIRLADAYAGYIDSIIVTASQVYPTTGGVPSGDPSQVTLSVNDSEPLSIETESPTARLPFVFLCDHTQKTSQINIKSSNRVFLYTIRIVYYVGTAGITDITGAEADVPAEYYDLNGIRIEDISTQPAGIFIERHGSHSRKIFRRP